MIYSIDVQVVKSEYKGIHGDKGEDYIEREMKEKFSEELSRLLPQHIQIKSSPIHYDVNVYRAEVLFLNPDKIQEVDKLMKQLHGRLNPEDRNTLMQLRDVLYRK